MPALSFWWGPQGQLEATNRIKGGLDVHMAMRILTKIRARCGEALVELKPSVLFISIPQ
jgi:hypothetical protein